MYIPYSGVFFGGGGGGGGVKFSWISKILLVRGKNFVVEQSSPNHTPLYTWCTNGVLQNSSNDTRLPPIQS